MENKREKTSVIGSLSWKRRIILIAAVIAVILIRNVIASGAEDEVRVLSVNYIEDSMVVQISGSNTQILYSDSAKKVWETLPGTIDKNGTIEMDISWVSPSKNQTITLKGNKSNKITTVVIPKQATNFKASFNRKLGKMTFTNGGQRTIQWRKKDSTQWKTVNPDTIDREVSYFFNNGATLIFRLTPVNGSSADDTGMRASKEVSVTIPKKTAAPAVRIDGSKFTISAPKGVVYRTVDQDGSYGEWITKSITGDLLISELAPQIFPHEGGEQEEVTLQFRRNATASAQISNIATIIIPIQRPKPSEEEHGISLSYTSSSSLNIQVKSASADKPFEFTVVKKGQELNYNTAKWTAITASTPVNVTKSTAPEESQIYLRFRSVEETSESSYQIASAAINITGTTGVSYPLPPTVNSITNLITTVGICNADNADGNLIFTLYSPTEATVSSIEMTDAYGNRRGSVETKSTVTKNTMSTGGADAYLVTTRIISTENVNSYTGERLFAKISMSNGDEIKSDLLSGIHLYLYPRTVVSSSEQTDYSKDFKRVYASEESEDAEQFSFRLNFGTEYVMDPSEIDKSTTQPIRISSLEYQGYTLKENTDFTVTYRQITGDDGRKKSVADVVVHVSRLEKNLPAKKLDQKSPISIHLNNQEVIEGEVYITLVSTAKVKGIPIAWSITEGSLRETQSKKVTDSDGNTTTITEDVVTYTIELELFDSAYSVSVSDVTWDGNSVMGSAVVSGGKGTIYLSNVKINKLTTDVTDTRNLVITLSNGFVISTGIKLTIIDAS